MIVGTKWRSIFFQFFDLRRSGEHRPSLLPSLSSKKGGKCRKCRYTYKYIYNFGTSHLFDSPKNPERRHFAEKRETCPYFQTFFTRGKADSFLMKKNQEIQSWKKVWKQGQVSCFSANPTLLGGLCSVGEVGRGVNARESPYGWFVPRWCARRAPLLEFIWGGRTSIVPRCFHPSPPKKVENA